MPKIISPGCVRLGERNRNGVVMVIYVQFLLRLNIIPKINR